MTDGTNTTAIRLLDGSRWRRPTQMESNILTSGRKLRIGAVSYLNTKPLVHQLELFAPDAELVYDLPSRLADDLADGRLDVALIPSIEYFQDPAYRIVSNACIGCRGPVLSVKLLSRKPLAELRTLALDEGSRTSVALVRILLEQRFGISPETVPLPIGVAPESMDTDAVLLIGDRAMAPPQAPFVEHWDLGDEWCRWAELPFVFAMWTARADWDAGPIEQALNLARDAGVSALDEIASREADRAGMPRQDCLSYLRDNLYFFLGPREQRGLALFYQHAARLGFAPAGRSLETIGQAVS